MYLVVLSCECLTENAILSFSAGLFVVLCCVGFFCFVLVVFLMASVKFMKPQEVKSRVNSGVSQNPLLL